MYGKRFSLCESDNIKPRQHCNYCGIHLNTLGSKILTDNFILSLNTLTWHRISQENDAFDKNKNNLPQDTLEDKGNSHINFENLSFSFLKKTKSKHPRTCFLNI